MEPIFLDWNRPLLHTLTDHLLTRFVKDGRLDMRHVVLTLTGRRAIHRLEELLAERVELLADQGKLDPAWYPPEFLTLGTLPERFYERNKPIADDLTQRFAWLNVCDRMEEDNPDLLKRFLPHPPKRTDQEARLALGKIFATLHRELAADAIDFKGVAELCRQLQIDKEASRWDALATLQKQYLDLLDSLEVWDLQTARLFAIKEQKKDEHARIVKTFRENDAQFLLVGLVDMNQAQKKILEKYSEFVTPIVFAPKSLENRFDSLGCLCPDTWIESKISLAEDQIRVVEKPTDQADAVLRKLAEIRDRFATDEIVIGVPDVRVIPYLRQRLDHAKIASRHFEGTPMYRTVVYRFLEALLGLLEEPTFRSFAEAIRHPDIEDFLRTRLAAENGPDENELDDILSELDKYHTEFLPQTIGVDWPASPEESRPERTRLLRSLRSLWKYFSELIGCDPIDPALRDARELPIVWIRRIEERLERLYGGKEEHILIEARKNVREAEETLLGVPDSIMPELTLAQTLQVLLDRLRTDNIPPREKPEAIELIGWLEIVMDDAPVVLVTGMNEGIVPSFLTADMFLPDKVRHHLGLEDNRRRYARDAYALSTILGTRRERPETVRLIGGRRSVEGDPLLPSRLFFATDKRTVAERVRRFFGTLPPQRPLMLADAARPGRVAESAFRAPGPFPPENADTKKIRSMRVTEFADYVRCPYRYYLKHRLRLDVLDDDAEELDARAFGNLVHDALEQFGRGPLLDATAPEPIRDHLESILRETSRDRFGSRPKPAVSIQVERALERLKAFAFWQAQWRSRGYRILHSEFSFDERDSNGRIFLEVDGDKMFLRGRIDRIDEHEESGELVVLDYKTSDSAAEPEKTHRRKDPEGVVQWTDFQLPLYHHILRRAGYREPISLGYVTLPKDVAKTDIRLAGWDDATLRTAIDQAAEIVRRIWSDDFTMVVPPPKFSELYAAICLDDVLSAK